jgi:hypothetical protein
MNKRNIIIIILVLVIICGVIGFYFYKMPIQKEEISPPNEELIYAKLVSIDTPVWNSKVENYYNSGSGYYEGILNFSDIKTNKNYSIIVASKDWSWVKVGNCYKINLTEVNQNIKRHETSMMFSEYYVGTLEQTSC